MQGTQSIAQRLLNVREYGQKENHQGEMPPLSSFYKTSLNIAGPATAEGVLASLIGSIDTMMVGTMGSTAIAAVGLTNQPRLIMLILIQSLSIGATAVIARRKGQQNPDAISRCFRQTLMLALFIGAVLSVVGNLLAEPIMRLAGANEDTLELSCQYFRIINGGLLLNCLSLVICACLRGIGLTRSTMVINVTANLVNVVFNYLLIGGNFGFPQLGVRGAAIATVTGNGVGACIALWTVLHKGSPMPLKIFEKWRFDRETLTALKGVSLSSIGENCCFRLGFLINARIVAGLGTQAFAAYQILSSFTTLSFTLGDGLSVAGATLVGQSLGRERKDMAVIYAKVLRRISLFLSIGLIVLSIAFRYPIIRLFTTEPEVIRYADISFWVVAAGMLPQNGRVVYSGVLRGAGDVGFVARMALISVTVLRPIFSYLFCYPMHMEVAGAWLAFTVDAFIRDFAFIHRVKTGRWLNIKV